MLAYHVTKHWHYFRKKYDEWLIWNLCPAPTRAQQLWLNCLISFKQDAEVGPVHFYDISYYKIFKMFLLAQVEVPIPLTLNAWC